MSFYCEHTDEWSDDSLLLDDDNTSTKNCRRCKKKFRNPSNDILTPNNWPINGAGSNSNMFIENEKVHDEDQLDSPDDSPLLSQSPILTTDYLHCHHLYKPNEDKLGLTKISLAASLCFLFMIAELIGGYLAGSLAIMTDAAHLFADLISFLMSIVSIKLSRKPATSTMTFGYARAEVVGALLSILAVWMLAILFLILAIQRLWTGAYEIDADIMIVIACLGLCVNILMGAVLHGVCHSSSPNLSNHNHHSHNAENINVRAAVAHVIGDLFQSIGVLIAAVIIKVYPTAKSADPICTVLFTFIVIFVTRKVARDSVIILMEASPRNVMEILTIFRNIPGVEHVHSLHVWSTAPGKDMLTAHLAVDNHCDRDTILTRALLVSREKFNITTCTIQIESYQEIMNECDSCKLYH